MRTAVRAGAAAAVAASIALPAMRRRLRLRPAATIAPRLPGRPGWPCSSRERARVTSPCTRSRCGASRWPTRFRTTIRKGFARAFESTIRFASTVPIGGGELPNARLQRALADPAEPNALDRFLSMVHWAWFFVPHVTLVYVLLRDDQLEPADRRFPRAARQMAATYDLGCAVYFAVPTAPPWWAAENGYADEDVRRLMVDVGEQVWGDAWPVLYDSLGGNPWAAMPSLHFATSLMAAELLRETGPVAGAMGWAYAWRSGSRSSTWASTT